MSGSIGIYKVVGRRRYRTHEPGTVFEARLYPDQERRAIQRGDIILLERITPTLPEGYRLPQDWPPGGADTSSNRETPDGVSLT